MEKVFVLILLVFSLSLGAKKEDIYVDLKMLTEIIDYIKNYYVEDVSERDLIYSAAHGMVRSLDPYSSFLTPRDAEELEIETEGRYGGLGIKISLAEDGYISIVTPFPGTPAFRAGIMPEDKIIKIGGEDIKGIKLEDAVKKLRGEPGTKVKITIFRESTKQTLDLELTREIIKIPTLTSKIIKEDIGYINLLEFNKNSYTDLKAEITKLMSQKQLKGLVLDLRYNPGGLLEAAVDVTKLFLGGRKKIVYTKGRIPESYREFYSDEKAPFTDIPLVVIINKGSASGSEIVAGALQDHKRAIIVGSKSFGKASVQSIYKLPGKNVLKLTTANYYTPSGRRIERDRKTGEGGITPDIVVDVDPETEIKLRKQEHLYYPDKPPVEKKAPEVKDVVLEKAVEIFKIREILQQIKGG